MKSRFVLYVILLIFLFSAWLYLSYDLSLSQKTKVEDITRLPVYAYVADSTKVSEIVTELKAIPGIKNIIHETGVEAANELIDSYGLPLSPEMISDYTFPDVITVNLEPTYQAVVSKPLIVDALRRQLPETDIDSQASAFNDLTAELKLIRNRMISFTIFAGVLMLLVYVFIRLSFELHVLLNYQGRKHSVVDKIRHHRQGVQHTWTMLLIPFPLCLIGYFALVYIRPLPQLIPGWMFVAQAGAAIVGTLISYFTLHAFEREVVYAEQPVQVLSTPRTVEEIEHETSDS